MNRVLHWSSCQRHSIYLQLVYLTWNYIFLVPWIGVPNAEAVPSCRKEPPVSSIPLRGWTTLGKKWALYSLPSNNLICIHALYTALYTIINEDKMGIFKHHLVWHQFLLTFALGWESPSLIKSCLPRPLLHFFQKQMPEKGTIILSFFIFNSQIIAFSAV